MNIPCVFLSWTEIPLAERAPRQPRARQTRSLLSQSRPSTGPITSQPSLHSALESVARYHRGSPHAITCKLKQIGARTIIPEAALAYSHGDPLPTRLHPVNNSEILLTNAGSGIHLPWCQSHTLSPTVAVPAVGTGWPHHADGSPDEASHPHDHTAAPSFPPGLHAFLFQSRASLLPVLTLLPFNKAFKQLKGHHWTHTCLSRWSLSAHLSHAQPIHSGLKQCKNKRLKTCDTNRVKLCK